MQIGKETKIEKCTRVVGDGVWTDDIWEKNEKLFRH